MTKIVAELIADHVSNDGVRITTMGLVYPWVIHPELMTHRSFARNASSSRAIPVSRMLKSVMDDPFMPLHLGKNQKGMQAYETISNPRERRIVYSLWKGAMEKAVQACRDMVDLCDLHKQIANRITSPWQHISVVVTATDWLNFFALRCHPAAEPHIRALAWTMADLYFGSTPKVLDFGQWHLPYVLEEERAVFSLEDLKKFSAARCARVSYRQHDGADPDPVKDLALCERLLAGAIGDDPLEPGHLSPFEHQATPLKDPNERSGPFRGWKQFRKEFGKENMGFDYEAAVAQGWREEALGILSVNPDLC